MPSLTMSMAVIFASCSGSGDEPGTPSVSTPYITKVLEYRPAPGQFVNIMPEYEEGDTQEDMNRKVLDAIGNNKRETITLGSYGGYVIVGFDHTIENKNGVYDFRVLGNAFVNIDSNSGMASGSCEAGVIKVAYDANRNGRPDDDEWFEIAGSAHRQDEQWYAAAREKGNDVSLYHDYEIKYYKPSEEPAGTEEEYIKWESNKGNSTSGYRQKNTYHQQPYYPQWINEDNMTFKGTCLPQNGIDSSGSNTNFSLYQFSFGYADNAPNNSNGALIDIDWAVDSNGNNAGLPGVDFICIYTGINQENGWLGECSTEIMGIEDLHVLGESINVIQ